LLPIYPDLDRDKWQFDLLFFRSSMEETIMPVLLIWAVPAVIVIGGAGYWLVHMH
jgi:hypothetical protein